MIAIARVRHLIVWQRLEAPNASIERIDASGDTCYDEYMPTGYAVGCRGLDCAMAVLQAWRSVAAERGLILE